MKPLLKYPGSKWRVANWIIAHFPDHSVYCEPFFGSGAVLFNKSPAYIETINDIDGAIVNVFRVCRENPQRLATLINLTPWSREEYINCIEKTDDPIEWARRTIVRYHQSFGSSNSSKKSWKNVQRAGGPRCATMWSYLPETIIECCDRLKQVQIENINGLELIKRYNHPDTLLYIDPPYLGDRKKNLYKQDMNSIEEHEQLLSIIKESKSKIVISAYDNEQYNHELKDWQTDEINCTAQMGLHRTEKIYMNFQSPRFGVNL